MANLGRLAWKRPLVPDLSTLAWECPLPNLGRLALKCLLVINFGRLVQKRPPVANWGR